MDHETLKNWSASNAGTASECFDSDKLFLVAQPVVPMNDRSRPAYYEMLLRVIDDAGLINTPDVLLKNAERDDTLEQLDGWVLRSTAQWLSQTPTASSSVNITAKSMRSGRAINDLRGALSEFDVDPARLMLELPEHFVTDDPDAFRRSVKEADELGVRIAIDDLGSEWRALSTIRDVGVDAIKIDGYWVSKATTDELAEITIRSIVNAARLIGARVVAEWIENEETFDLISDMGIQYGQGWLFGYPTPLGDVDTAALAIA